MFITLISILVAAGVILYPTSAELIYSQPLLFTLFPLLLTLVPVFVWIWTFLPLQKAEERSTPRVIELVNNDWQFKWMILTQIGASFLAIFCSLVPAPLRELAEWMPLVLWLIAVGISIDFIYMMVKRLLSYLNPFNMVTLLSNAAKLSIEIDKEIDLCNWTEAISEVGVKSLNRASSSLCQHSIAEMREVLRLFLDSSKSIAHRNEDEQSRSLGITDSVSYTLFYFLDRYATIYKKALDMQMEPTCSAIVTTLGKTVIDAARCDLSLVAYPVQYIGNFCVQAEAKKMNQVSIKGSCTLVEASKVIVSQLDLTYQELKAPYSAIITQLDAIAKETFRGNKDSNIKLLIQPLVDLKAQFQNGKIATHRDTPLVISMIDSVLAEWDTLATVLRTIPPLPKQSLKDES